MNVRSKHDDGRIGWPENGPFDAISSLPRRRTLVDALTANNSRWWLPDRAGRPSSSQSLLKMLRTPMASSPTALAPVVFVPLLSGMID